MAFRKKVFVLAGLLAALVAVSAGCDLATLSYFLSAEQPLPAKLKHLASKKTEPKVLILTYVRPDAIQGVDFIHADRQIAEMLGRNMQQNAEKYEEKLALLPQRRVEEFKNANPDWKAMGNVAVGRQLGADYVVYLEINSLSLYEPGSNHSLFRGRANVNIQVLDVNKPDELPMQEVWSCAFPSAQGPVPVAVDTSPLQFRQKFLEHVAHQLTQYCSNYPRDEQRSIEPVF
jgi:hypothetical protein